MDKPDFANIVIESVLDHIRREDPQSVIKIRETLTTDTAMLAFVLFCINTAAGTARMTVLTPSLN